MTTEFAPFDRAPFGLGEVKPAVGIQARRVKDDFPEFWQYLIDELCRLNKLSYLPSVDSDRLTQMLEGRRWVALALQHLVEAPLDNPPEPPPRPRTMTERVRQRNS